MRLKDFAKEVSIVHQYNTAPVDLSVEKLVGYGRTPYHTMGLSPDPKEDEEKIRRALEITHTWKHRDKPVSELSGGQKQRVWIAMALAQDTRVLFLDEPTSGVDPRTRREFWKHINAMTQNGVAVLVTTHFMEEAEYCDEIALVFQGGIIARGTPDELKGKAPGAAKNGGAADMTLEEAFIAYIEEVQRKGGHA